jgi:tRNA modification GTPase
MLAALARAASPAAIDPLLAQPALWRDYLAKPASQFTTDGCEVIVSRSRTLDRLIDPPGVVVVGRANVGKSTLTNRLMGRPASLVADLPGTTRDWVGGLVELSPESRVRSPESAVAVRWLDTPGMRDSDDPIEQRAIELAKQVVADADVLIAMRDADSDWPDPSDLPGAVDLHVVNKSDLPDAARDNDRADVLHISALTGEGLDELQECILGALALSDVSSTALWAFSPRLRELMRTGDIAALRAYAEP